LSASEHRRGNSSHCVGYHAPHEAGRGVTRRPRAAAPSPGLGAKTCTPRTSTTLPDPTTRIAGAHRPSRELGPLHPYPCASTCTTARVEPRPGSVETAPAALREKLVPMRDTPDRQLQLDFQRRAPEPAPIAPTLRPERAPHFTTLGSLRLPGPGSVSAFSSDPNRGPVASDAPHPLTRRRVNDTGLKCELGTPSPMGTAASPPLAVTTRRLARPTAPSAATDGVPERARQHSPTSAIDAKPEHTGERSLPGAPPLFTTKRCASRRSGDAETAPTVQSGVSAVLGTEAGSGC
jgi:hypothetical protein